LVLSPAGLAQALVQIQRLAHLSALVPRVANLEPASALAAERPALAGAALALVAVVALVAQPVLAQAAEQVRALGQEPIAAQA
jgi:hypothetical protein